MVDTFLQTFQGRFLLSVLNQWMDETKRGVLSAILLDWGLYVCCLADICCPVSPTVLLLVTNIAQFLNHHHHHLLSLPSVNHCQSACSLTSPHQPLKLIKRGISQSSISRTNLVWLAALAHWELLKLKMWKWTILNWNWRWGYLEGKVGGRSIVKTSIREMILRKGPPLPSPPHTILII